MPRWAGIPGLPEAPNRSGPTCLPPLLARMFACGPAQLTIGLATYDRLTIPARQRQGQRPRPSAPLAAGLEFPRAAFDGRASHDPFRGYPAMTVIKPDDLIESVAAGLQFISYYHPADYIEHLARAYEAEQSPAARDAIAQILTNSRICAEGHRPICQDTGIVNVYLKVGMDVR